MPSNWNKGQTKYTNPSVKKISDTMKLRKINNFKIWMDRMKVEGKIKSKYPSLKKNGDLAELVGVILGDGHIGKFPRTESLRIVANSSNEGFIKRYSDLIEKVFNKRPYVAKRKKVNAVNITIYEKNISKRLGIPSGARLKLPIKVPNWIKKDKKYIVSYLRGLYEAEGSLHFHAKTYTHKLLFSNSNISMLDNVLYLLNELKIFAHRSKNKIQISKKEEVKKAVNLLNFRVY